MFFLLNFCIKLQLKEEAILKKRKKFKKGKKKKKKEKIMNDGS